MPGIKAVGTVFEVFKGFALTTKSGLLKNDLVWSKNCVMTLKEHSKELKKEERTKEMCMKIQNNKDKWEQIVNTKGPFIRPKLRIRCKT